jgi:hypothetical protein
MAHFQIGPNRHVDIFLALFSVKSGVRQVDFFICKVQAIEELSYSHEFEGMVLSPIIQRSTRWHFSDCSEAKANYWPSGLGASSESCS